MASSKCLLALRLINKRCIKSAILQSSAHNVFSSQTRRSLHLTARTRGLEEFFDAPENWAAMEVKHGRGWRVEELRQKSNEDIHKLWYVLLKELNMLLTMEHASKEECVLFPSPERLDRVRDSMAHIEEVVRERNMAYHLLETGETGERPSAVVKTALGRMEHRQFTEHAVPREFNPDHQKFTYQHHPKLDELNKLMDEKEMLDKEDEKKWERQHICRLIAQFPDMDLEALKEQYPDHDIEAYRRHPDSRGHHDRNLA